MGAFFIVLNLSNSRPLKKIANLHFILSKAVKYGLYTCFLKLQTCN